MLSWRLVRIFSGTRLSSEDRSLEVGCRVHTSSPCQTAVQSDCTNLHFLQPSMQVSFVPHPLKTWYYEVFKIFANLMNMKKRLKVCNLHVPIRILMFIDYLNHLLFNFFFFSFHIAIWFYYPLFIGVKSRNSESRLPGFKFWLHHTHLVSEDTLLDLPFLFPHL